MWIEYLFWANVALIFYVYVGYFVLCAILAVFANRRVAKGAETPTVTVVIAAFNEEAEIEATVRNKLDQDYPSGRLKVLVVSDGSTDATEQIVEELASEFPERLRLIRQSPRQGKTQALNVALEQIRSEIVVFSDANSHYAEDTVRMLAENFADPSVGYVTGRMVYTTKTTSGVADGSRRYMDYENALRSAETRIGSVVGVDGGVDAVRRDQYCPMRGFGLPDFVLPLNVVRNGKRVVYEPRALLFEEALCHADQEFRMRIRVCLRALWTLFEMRELFNPVRYPALAWQLASHKLLRYLAFIPLGFVVVLNLLLLTHGTIYVACLAMQCVFYGGAVVGYVLQKTSISSRVGLGPYYFCLVNFACTIALLKFLRGQRITTWAPRLGV